ncbi:diaminopimelate decarboxylase family protein [Agathobaculum sp.]|uniref:diaminopimelate decarboxylase family protein n=1 Tax=Agathobaculum sp. TaxID=2048138 RepID=UPI0027BB0C59|nr:alanine racemase [Agathobaculum sp.]
MTDEQIHTLTTQYGTPLYVFDINVLRRRIAYLRNSLPGVRLCFAVKANPFLLQELRGFADRFEVCSPGEAEICNRAHIPAAQQVISGVYKTPSVMEKMIAQGNGPRLFTVESVRQFRLLSGLAEQYRKPINVLLRLTSGNQFGMEEQEIVQLVQEREEYPLVCIRGIQFFSGTQKTSLKRLRRELEAVDTFVCALQETCGFTVQELEFGPGFPVNYFQGQAFDEDAFLAGFSGLLAGLRCGARVTLELGRSIAASCGSYLTRVVDVKQNRGQNYAIVDGGMHQMVYYGQSMAMQHPQCRIYPPRSGDAENWNLCGSLCTVNDILVKQLPVAGLKCGDVFAFGNTGAYCMTEGISLFLSRALPRIVLLRAEGAPLLVREALPTDRISTSHYERMNHHGKADYNFAEHASRRGFYLVP